MNKISNVNLSDYDKKVEVNGIKQELSNKIDNNKENINTLNKRMFRAWRADLTNYYTKSEVDYKTGVNSNSIEGLNKNMKYSMRVK